MALADHVATLATKLFDTIDPADPSSGDLLFNIFGIGNAVAGPDQPFERFCHYEELLKILRTHSRDRFLTLHKGTAFWFLSWLAFDLRNYPKALFYMDAAISEDFRRAPAVWLTEPAGRFLTLDAPHDLGAARHIRHLRELLDQQLSRFNRLSGDPALTIDDFLSGFVTTLLETPQHRTIVSAWYVHLLEFEERHTDLELRSSVGGSIAPFLDHLFRGGLMLESLLKVVYQVYQVYQPATGSKRWTLGDIFNSTNFRQDFGSNFETSADDIATILKSIGKGAVVDAFSTSAKLRNTTGHNLVWDDAFTDVDTYQCLFEREIDAMLFVISRKFRPQRQATR